MIQQPNNQSDVIISRYLIRRACQDFIQNLKDEPFDNEQAIEKLKALLISLKSYRETYNERLDTLSTLVNTFESNLKETDAVNIEKDLQQLLSALKSLSTKLLEINDLKNAVGIDESQKNDLILLEGNIQKAMQTLTKHQPPSNSPRSLASSSLPKGKQMMWKLHSITVRLQAVFRNNQVSRMTD